MPRFTLSQMLAAIGFIAIALLFTQSEGCGRRFAMIESLSFSSDDSRILVTKLTARDAETPGKGYKADIARWVSWLDSASGSSLEIVRQDFAPGNRYTARQMWRVGRTTTACIPPDDQVAVLELGGGQVLRDVGSQKPIATPGVTAVNIVASQSGRYIAASGNNEVNVFDIAANRIVMKIPNEDPFLNGSPLAFMPGEKRLVVASEQGTHVWDINSSTKISTIRDNYDRSINSIVTAPDDTVILGCDGCLLRYDLDGNLVKRLSDKGSGGCTISDDGRWLAVTGYQKVSIFDLSTNQLLSEISVGEYATSLALNSEGSKVAVGGYSGCVQMFDAKFGNRLWFTYPPGRYRLPWTVPLVFLAGWTLIVWRFSRQRPKKDAA